MANKYLDHLQIEEDAVPTLLKPITAISSTNYSVLSTTGSVLAASSVRRYARIQNNGTVDVWINLGATAEVSHGIKLTASGGSYEINDKNRYTGIITGISNTTGQSVTVLNG